jgi:Tol biopolymer transport system component/tRNA A-37 threonylcarbamoyl transferase component Bud32
VTAANIDRLTAALADRYRIERELGAGGMATVYLAQDLKHDRKVAVKVLRPELAAVIGADRFLSEIKTTANLQHPHILPLFDSGAADSFLYYVMPFIEGESLRDRLSREKQLPIAEAVRIASEVASALHYAHRHGVIHRDIKPENVMLHDGSALVADFGIALAASKAGGSRMTDTGMSLGTPHYMSPEQAMGEREITARSDVYALGAMTYEMLTGDPPFTGSTAQAIVAKVMTDEPAPPCRHRKAIPEHVEVAVLTALEKLPADRWNSAAEFSQALAGNLTTGRSTQSRRAAPAPAVRSARIRLIALSSALVLMALLAAWGWMRNQGTVAAGGVMRFVVTLPASEQIAEAPDQMITMAPDGSGFVYVGVGHNGRQLYHRRFESFLSRPLPGTEDATGPFFSPDGSWVGFRAKGKLLKVRLAGGAPVTLTDDVNSSGSSWGTDGRILFVRSSTRGIWAVSENGGEPSSLTVPDSASGEAWHAYPRSLPNGDLLLNVFTGGTMQVAIAERGSGKITPLFAGWRPVYERSGHLVFLLGDSLRAIRYDMGNRRAVGAAFAAEQSSIPGSGIRHFSLSESGALLTMGARADGRRLVEVDRQGREMVLSPDARPFDGPRYSPDGRRIAVRISGDEFHIWNFDIARETFSRLTFSSAENFFPEWTSDGRRIVYTRRSDSTGTDIYWTDADGGGQEEAVYVAPGDQWETSFGRSGDRLVFRQNDSLNNRDLWVLSMRDRRASTLLATSKDERAARLSPDGRFLAYVSDQSDDAEVYVRTFPDSAGTWLVSQGGGTEPAWSPDGRELYYRSGDWLMAVPIVTQPGFSVGRRDSLFAGPYVPNPTHTNYDVHPAGNRFVMVRSSESERRVVVALNWLSLLAERTGSED